jgi:hypothetical protein
MYRVSFQAFTGQPLSFIRPTAKQSHRPVQCNPASIFGNPGQNPPPPPASNPRHCPPCLGHD